jgi:chemotaxis protein MotB
MNARTISIAMVLSLATPACVSAGRYDNLVAEKRTSDDALADAQRKIRELEARITDRQARLEDIEGTATRLQKDLDDETVVDAQLRTELTKLGKDVDALLVEAKVPSLEKAKERLAELRRAQAAAEARAALYADLLLRFKKMLEAGDLAVVVRDGRMILRLSNDVLFDSGRIEIKPAGRKALTAIAEVLHTMTDRHFQIAGHTDDQPINVSPYASNWELSSARALEVVGFLVKQGMKPEVLSAAGYGEFDPLISNATAAGKAKNRRIEIVLQPKIEEFVVLPTSTP